ncbi:MAG: transposase [Clostridium sp.]
MLDKRLDKISLLNIKELNSFSEEIKRDIKAVKYSIITTINNGLAEGSVNKIKVIKRIMYGRCNFDLLKQKVINMQFI